MLGELDGGSLLIPLLTLFSSRNIAYILKAIWDNPTHREALNIEAKYVMPDVHNIQ
jgi:hypothetical protein